MLITDDTRPIDLTTTPLHLGPGSRARAVQGFAWDPEVLRAYTAAVEADGPDGRLVAVIDEEGRGDHWERHPGGDEVVICLEGSVTVVRDADGGTTAVRLAPGQATVNPAGTWHAVDVDGPGRILTITPGVGTEHRPRPTG